MKNIDSKTVDGFGDEWTRFDQSSLSAQESKDIFEQYFRVFPWHDLPSEPVGFDLGCGSGRWAKHVALRVGRLHCIDASSAALQVARRNLESLTNCDFHNASVDEIPLEDGSMNFGYSLGVLHHVPDTQKGILSCVNKLKPGAPLLLYLYYAFDNRSLWFRLLWKISDFARRSIAPMPYGLRYGVSAVIALIVYFPLARLSCVLERFGLKVNSLPLSFYRKRSFYTMRTDALDRFGTRLEQRFTAKQIREMMENAGLENIKFSQSEPYWCAVGTKKL